MVITRSLRRGSALKAMAAWIALAAMPALAWACFTVTAQLAARWTPAWRVEDAIVLAAAASATVIASYLGLLGAGMVASAALGRRRWERGLARVAPMPWRRVAATALGMSLASGVAGPALAADGADDGGEAPLQIAWVATPEATAPSEPAEPSAETEPSTGTEPSAEKEPSAKPEPSEQGPSAPAAADANASHQGALAPATTQPDPPAPAPAPAPTPTPTPTPTLADTVTAPAAASVQDLPGETYTVSRGDSLWTITADLLGVDATSVEIAQAWPILYDANRDVVGADPGLIYSGQVLVIPGGLA